MRLPGFTVGRTLFMVALLTAGTSAMAGSAAAASPGTRAYSGKNGLIAFVRSNQIYTISAGGTSLKQLTSSGKNYNPVWNPAGTEIAYEHEAPAGVRNIWVMNVSGSNKRQWTNTGNTYGSPAWSPNGKTLLFTNGGQWGTLQTTSGITPLQARRTVYGYNLDQGSTYTVLQGNNPAWGTGGIAFTSSNQFVTAPMCGAAGGSGSENPSCIEVYDPSTKQFSNPYSLNGYTTAWYCPYGGPATAVDWARWAPDGSNIINEYQLGIQDPSTGDCTNSPWYIATVYGSAFPSKPGDQQADYSPDGTRIVVANALPGQKANILVESDTGANRRTLTQGYQPNWQPLP